LSCEDSLQPFDILLVNISRVLRLKEEPSQTDTSRPSKILFSIFGKLSLLRRGVILDLVLQIHRFNLDDRELEEGSGKQKKRNGDIGEGIIQFWLPGSGAPFWIPIFSRPSSEKCLMTFLMSFARTVVDAGLSNLLSHLLCFGVGDQKMESSLCLR
jgi:hypothetical protein